MVCIRSKSSHQYRYNPYGSRVPKNSCVTSVQHVSSPPEACDCSTTEMDEDNYQDNPIQSLPQPLQQPSQTRRQEVPSRQQHQTGTRRRRGIPNQMPDPAPTPIPIPLPASATVPNSNPTTAPQPAPTPTPIPTATPTPTSPPPPAPDVNEVDVQNVHIGWGSIQCQPYSSLSFSNINFNFK